MPKNSSVWNWIFFFQSKERNVCKRRLSIFVSFEKLCPDKYFSAKNFQRLKLNTLFSIKRRKWKKCMTINFCHLLKIVSRQKFHAKKFQCLKIHTLFSTKEVHVWENKVWVSVFVVFLKWIPTSTSMPKISLFEIEYTFFKQRNEIYVEKDYQFLPLFKKYIPTKTSMPKISVFEIEYTFFNQRNEMYAKENNQFFSLFKKCIPTKTSMPKIFSVWNWKQFFQPMEVNVKESKVWLSIFFTFQKWIPTCTSMPKNFSVWSWIQFFNQRNELYVEEDYQFCYLSKNKFIQVKTSIPRIQCLKVNILFSNIGTNYLWEKTISFCHR